MSELSIQDATPAHHHLILDSFLHEYRETMVARHAPPAVLLAKMRALLLAPTWRALVCLDPEYDEVLGFLVYRDPACAGWLQVKKKYRKRGVARALCAAAGLSTFCLDVAFMPDRRKAGWPQMRFRPYLPDVAQLDTEILEMVG